MAGVTRQLTRPALTALICAGIWVFGLLWMWFDFHYGSSVWTITPGPILLMLAMVIAAPVLLVSGIVLAHRKSKGLPVFTVEVPAEPELESPKVMQDPLDPTYLLKNPPAGAQVTSERGRRVVVLADGSVIGELLSGRAQRFASLAAFREFVGS